MERRRQSFVFCALLVIGVSFAGCAALGEGAMGVFAFPASCGPEAYKDAVDEHASVGERALGWAGMIFSPAIGAANGVWQGLKSDVRVLTGQTKESLMYDDVDKANLKKTVHPCGGENPNSHHHKR